MMEQKYSHHLKVLPPMSKNKLKRLAKRLRSKGVSEERIKATVWNPEVVKMKRNKP